MQNATGIRSLTQTRYCVYTGKQVSGDTVCSSTGKNMFFSRKKPVFNVSKIVSTYFSKGLTV